MTMEKRTKFYVYCLSSLYLLASVLDDGAAGYRSTVLEFKMRA